MTTTTMSEEEGGCSTGKSTGFRLCLAKFDARTNVEWFETANIPMVSNFVLIELTISLRAGKYPF